MSRLSEIEISIIHALARGLQSKEIANELNRSRPTIEFYIRMLFVKMNARSRAQVVARAYEIGLLKKIRPSPEESGAGVGLQLPFDPGSVVGAAQR